MSSRSGTTFCPKPPPTSRVITRTLVLGDAEQPGGEHPHLVRRLRGRPDGQLAAAPRPLRDQAAGLHRHGAVRLLPDRLADHVRGAVVGVGDRLGGRAAELAREVAGVALVHEGFRRPGASRSRRPRAAARSRRRPARRRPPRGSGCPPRRGPRCRRRTAPRRRRAAAAACRAPASPSRCTRPRRTSPLRSAAVKTACTPGSASAAEVSMETMRARGCGLRTKQACSMPGRVTSSTKVPAPVSSRASSTRCTRLPA